MRNLQFLNPVFHAGTNVTVRKGVKWADVRPKDIINLSKTGKKPFGTAEIVSVFIGAIEMIPHTLLKLEHDPECRDYLGLKSVMINTYGDIKRGEIVTVLEFLKKD